MYQQAKGKHSQSFDDRIKIRLDETKRMRAINNEDGVAQEKRRIERLKNPIVRGTIFSTLKTKQEILDAQTRIKVMKSKDMKSRNVPEELLFNRKEKTDEKEIDRRYVET